jgi:hypothetical protein
MPDLDSAEDAKLLVLAKGARGRVSARQGAALRDETGRTYASARVDLPSLTLDALTLVVAQAAASGARGAEAAVVVGDDPEPSAIDALRDLARAGVPVWVCSPDGSVRAHLTT